MWQIFEQLKAWIFGHHRNFPMLHDHWVGQDQVGQPVCLKKYKYFGKI